MILRRAKETDIDELIRLRLDFLEEAQPGADPERKTLCREKLGEYFQTRLPAEEFIAWIAIDGESVVATSGLCFHHIAPSFKNISGGTAYILNMYTIPTHRGRGLASSLFAKMIEEARARGYGKIALHATESGRPVYEKFGFVASRDEMIKQLD